jgi:RNA polymerase sigma factor (sigma-70 family)
VRAARASRHSLARASDERLTHEIRAGNEAAFEVVYERYERALLAFSRHMLGSRAEAEDALQQAFSDAWAYLRDGEQPAPPRLKPWLFAIARNRCLSVLRARKPAAAELDEAPDAAGLIDEVARRADVRALLADLAALPEAQRAALLLSELGGFSHADIADVLGHPTARVKGHVFQARGSLIDWRTGRESPWPEI